MQTETYVEMKGALVKMPESVENEKGWRTKLVIPIDIFSKDGEPKKKPFWMQVTCFGELAEKCRDCLNIGDVIVVEGRLSASRWEVEQPPKEKGDEPEKIEKTNIEVVASDIKRYLSFAKGVEPL